jgi:hypothetical protein
MFYTWADSWGLAGTPKSQRTSYHCLPGTSRNYPQRMFNFSHPLGGGITSSGLSFISFNACRIGIASSDVIFVPLNNFQPKYRAMTIGISLRLCQYMPTQQMRSLRLTDKTRWMSQCPNYPWQTQRILQWGGKGCISPSLLARSMLDKY